MIRAAIIGAGSAAGLAMTIAAAGFGLVQVAPVSHLSNPVPRVIHPFKNRRDRRDYANSLRKRGAGWT